MRRAGGQPQLIRLVPKPRGGRSPSRGGIVSMVTSELVLAAMSRLASSEAKRPLLVCVDGFGESGKSTLTALLRHAREVSAVVEGDDFYGPEGTDWAGFSPREGHERFFDHERLAREVLRPLGAPSTPATSATTGRTTCLLTRRPRTCCAHRPMLSD